MELIGLFLFIFVFGAICNALKPGVEQWEQRRVAKLFKEAAEKGRADHLSTARPSTKG